MAAKKKVTKIKRATKKSKPIKPIKKSKQNKSGAPSAAKREAQKSAKLLKAKKSKISKPSTPKKAVAKKAKVNIKKSGYSYKLSSLNPQLPKQLPATKLTDKGMTLRQLLKSTPRLFRENSVYVTISELSKTLTRSGMPAVKSTTWSDGPIPNKVKRKHSTIIIGYERLDDHSFAKSKAVNKHKKVLVSCNCESFVFGGAEYANAVHGCSRIVYGNGNPPVMTNPTLTPFLCKHLVALARRVIERKL